MKEVSKLIFIALVLISISCKKGNSDETELADKYFRLQKIGWKSKQYTQKIGGISFTAIEVPIQYYLLKDQGIENLSLVDSIYHANKSERVIEFSFEQEDEKDLLQSDFTNMDYGDGIKYMSFALDKDFYVVTGKNDTIRCAGVNFERNFKIAPFQKVLLFFSGIDPDDKIQLIYNDQLFRNGIMKFKFEDTYTEIKL